jgi:hypothetical protein
VKNADDAGFQGECLKLKSRITMERHLEGLLASILQNLKKRTGGIDTGEFNPL